MGLVKKIKQKLQNASDILFNSLMATQQISMLCNYLWTPTRWNPNTEDVFDAMWAWNYFVGFMDEFTSMAHEVPMNTDCGIIMYGFTYQGFHYRVNFAHHNPRVLTISIIDIYPVKRDNEGNEMKCEDDSLVRQFQAIANEYNKLDMRHLVRVGWLADEVSPVVRVSIQVAITPEFGDKMTIKAACDELREYVMEFVTHAFDNKLPEPESFDQHFLLPEGNYCSGQHPYFKGQKNALEHWFGLHSRTVFGDGNVQESDNEVVRSLPIGWKIQNEATKDVLAVVIPLGDEERIIEFHRSELDKLQVRVRKENQHLYTLEANNLKSLLYIPDDRRDLITDENLIAVCKTLTWNDHNQLIRVVWQKQPDGNYDFSIIASGVWIGEGQSFAKIDQIGEFMKNLAVFKYCLNHNVN